MTITNPLLCSGSFILDIHSRNLNICHFFSWAILTTYCFKKLAILSLREVAVLLRNRADQIGTGDKETRKNNKQYNMRAIDIRAADLARLEHARMHEALRN